MGMSKKRQADEEAQSSRARKRQAATPTTRITRSSRKLNADNGIAVQLNPGLPMLAPRQRKKPARSAPTQRKGTPPAVEAASRADSLGELAMLPATTYASAPQEPAKQAYTKIPSVIYATGITLDGREIRAPIRIGSDHTVHRRSEMMGTETIVDRDMTGGAPWLEEAANPGGPAPVAYMGGGFPMTITCLSDVPPHEDAQRKSSLTRRRKLSHSSLISPRSGPAQVCSIPMLSRGDASLAPSASGSTTNTDTPETVTEIKLDWTRLNPDWLNRSNKMWKGIEAEPQSAVVDATYSVNTVEEAAELLANEKDAQIFEQNLDPPVVEIFVPDSPHPIFHEDVLFAQMRDDSSPVIVTCGTNTSSFDNMEWTMSDNTIEVGDLQSDATMSGLATPTENTKTCCSSTTAGASFFARNSSTRGSVSRCIIDQAVPHPVAPVEPVLSHFAAPAADTPLSPASQKRAALRIANLKREKELRAKLIEMRRARKVAPPRFVQNVLVRSEDGSMSIVTTENTLVMNWGMEEDQYSVEEYDEDSVSY